MKPLNNLILTLSITTLLSSCVTFHSKQYDAYKKFFAKKESELWSIHYKEKASAIPLNVKKEVITFSGKNNIQIDFNGWEIIEVRGLQDQKINWKQINTNNTLSFYINDALAYKARCSRFYLAGRNFIRDCRINNTETTFQDTLIRNQNDLLIGMKFFLSESLGFIELHYEKQN